MLCIPTYRVTRHIELVFTHTMYMKILLYNLSRKRLSGKVIVRETSVKPFYSLDYNEHTYTLCRYIRTRRALKLCCRKPRSLVGSGTKSRPKLIKVRFQPFRSHLPKATFVTNFTLKFRGWSNIQNIPPSYSLDEMSNFMPSKSFSFAEREKFREQVSVKVISWFVIQPSGTVDQNQTRKDDVDSPGRCVDRRRCWQHSAADRNYTISAPHWTANCTHTSYDMQPSKLYSK